MGSLLEGLRVFDGLPACATLLTDWDFALGSEKAKTKIIKSEHLDGQGFKITPQWFIVFGIANLSAIELTKYTCLLNDLIVI